MKSEELTTKSTELHIEHKEVFFVSFVFSLCSLWLILLYSGSALAAEPAATLTVQEKWADVFGGKKAVYHVEVTAKEATQARLGWQFAIGGGTVARGEQAVAVEPARAARVDIPLDVPTVKDGVVTQAKLAIALYTGNGEKAVATADKDIWIFPEDSFYLKKEFLTAAKIRLFDPEKRTSKLFEETKVPFELVGNLDSFTEFKDGLVIVGEGVSFKDYRGLGDMMVKTAARGIPVLCLAPAGGEMTLPGTGDIDLPRPKSMRFAGNEIITGFDKRLDAEAWPPDGKVVAGGLKLRGERGPVMGETAKEGAWPWVEMEFAGRGRLVICGFGIVEKWKDSPTPRFLFVRMLEYVAEKKN